MKTMQVYNTLSRQKEELEPKKIRLFVCGPTVYDYSHIGHAKTYVFFDVFVKYLRSQGRKVIYLENITDVDDKIIARAEQEGKKPKELATFFEKEYMSDMKSLGVDAVDSYERATDHIPEIVSQIERLLTKGYAYETEDGIYYDIAKFAEYGKLSGRTSQQAEDAVSRIDESVNKRNRGDFALWKFSEKGPSWKSPWGAGRPGWHIEDTAITEKHFGSQYEIHGGARDLLFPHHEAEVAQMEAISESPPLARYWMHVGFLTVEGEKMSKSKGNFLTIQDFLSHHSPRLLRFLILKSHYRSPMDYTEELLHQTKKELERIDEFVWKLEDAKGQDSDTNILQKARESFTKAMEDDLNTPEALAAVFELVREGNALFADNKLSKGEAKDILTFLKEQDAVFACLLPSKREIPPKTVRELLLKREEARSNQAWQEADQLRKEIQQLGWEIEDMDEGPRLKPIA
ncbi:MAG: cysteine--tRNA ligase [bacterium]|nr:cysteine--tRNA ligase [bacterium]